ncbi:hypothetical protein J4216_03930 [Candidatus Woesearchaeota archaeon]|nr:hypothetical protein [Candidatus Woesearchaeota archaeon]
MKFENLSEQEVPILSRKRIKFSVDNEKGATPKKETITQELAKKYSTKPELVRVRHIYSHFGSQQSKVIAHIYEDEKTLKYLETPKGKKEKRVKKKKKSSK